jgi:hypothetical protein
LLSFEVNVNDNSKYLLQRGMSPFYTEGDTGGLIRQLAVSSKKDRQFPHLPHGRFGILG